jgi:GNAT superfamily N-acetyltransferase
MKLRARPLTPDLWPALEDLFGKNGACNGCWCMYWRVGAAYRKRPAGQNKAAFREIVKRGPPPGLIAFDGDKAVGWCQLTPRDARPWLDRQSRLKRIDKMPLWSLSCFYVRKGYRRKGVTAALIAAALKAAKGAKAPAREAYPLDADQTLWRSNLSGRTTNPQ